MGQIPGRRSVVVFIVYQFTFLFDHIVLSRFCQCACGLMNRRILYVRLYIVSPRSLWRGYVHQHTRGEVRPSHA